MRRHEQSGQPDRQNPDRENEAHQRRRAPGAIRPPRALRDRAAVWRWASPAMIARRSASLIVIQAPISAAVRPQPMHRADSGSMTQTLMQGVEIGADTGRYLGGRVPDEKSAPGGDLAALLRGAGDVAGLSADRAASQRDYAQGPGAAHQRREQRMDEAERGEAERERNDEGGAPGGGERAQSRAARRLRRRRRRAPAAEARAASARPRGRARRPGSG